MRKVLKKIKKILLRLGIFDEAFSLYTGLASISTRLKNRFNKVAGKTVPILLYHRIDTLSKDPSMLAVSPDTFEEHVKFINLHYKPVSLSELISRINSKSIRGDEIALTFDDGYRDNLLQALPILERYNTPATIFITTARCGEQAAHDWDMQYSEHERAYFLSPAEIKQVSQHRLIEIGAHTHNHPRLSDLSEQEQRLEIETSQRILEDITGKKIKHFAYPFGAKTDFDRTSVAIVKSLGFASACENTGLLGTHASDIYSLPRINVRDVSVDRLSRQIYAR